MELAENNIYAADAPTPEVPKGFLAGLRRIPEGLKDGSMIGLITGGLTAGGILALDSVFPGVGDILHIDSAVGFTAKMAGLHAVAHAGLDAYTEFKEGVRGIPDGKDMYHQYVESLEHKVQSLEKALPQQGLAAQAAPELGEQNPAASSAVIQAILAQRNNPQQTQASWQERVAAQQALQNAQDRTV